MVVCNTMGCPFCTEGFCSRGIVTINEGGGCDWIYKFANNVLNIRPGCFDPVDLKYKTMPIIVESEVKNDVQENTENNNN